MCFSDNDVVKKDVGKDICNKCCHAGPTEHGNEKCGLALDSHSFAFDLIRQLSDGDENIVVSPFRCVWGFVVPFTLGLMYVIFAVHVKKSR